jgi:4-amino-4-deoxy-L-arabinose transferase-like glycosyltransferase
VLVLAAGIALRLSETVQARLWIDEYLVLEIASQPTAPAVAAMLSREANPPLYFLLAHAVLGTSADPEVALRFLSFLAGVLTVLLSAWTSWRRWGPVASVVAATLVSLSAVAVHYSAEMRPFALLGFVTLLYLEALDRELAAPSAASLAAEGLLIVLATSFHAYGAPLLFVGPAVCLIGGRRERLGRQVLATAAAGLVLLPSVLLPLLRLPPETNEYLAVLWNGRSVLAPAGLVLRELLPVSRGPSALTLPGDGFLRGAEGAAVLLVGAIALAALAAAVSRRTAWRPDTYTQALFVLLAGNAVMATLFTAIGRSMVAPGRFAASLVAPFALAVAAASQARPAGRALAGALAVVAVLAASFRAAHPPPRGLRPEALSAEVLGRNVTGPSLVLSVGMSGVPLRYALRGRPDVTFRTYPLEIEGHVGWWAPRRALGRPDDLARDADVLARVASGAARSGKRVFLEGADHPVAAPLLRALAGSFRARPLNRLDAGLVELVPIEGTPAGDAR